MTESEKVTWHTAKTAARHAAVSEWTIRQAVQEGDLQAFAVRTGRGYRIKESDVDAWLSSTPFEPGRSA